MKGSDLMNFLFEEKPLNVWSDIFGHFSILNLDSFIVKIVI